jgi:hypothetical protein
MMHDASTDISGAVQLAVAEGLVWRAVEMYQHLDLGALAGPPQGRQVAAASDKPVQIALVSLTDLALAVRSALQPCCQCMMSSTLSWLTDQYIGSADMANRSPYWHCQSAMKAGLIQTADFVIRSELPCHSCRL